MPHRTRLLAPSSRVPESAVGLAVMLAAFVLLSLDGPLSAADDTNGLSSAQTLYEAGNYSGALKAIEPVLTTDNARERQIAERYAAACHHAIGDDFFRAGNMKRCIESYDAELKLIPERKPHHWQRGIALYYAKRYQDGVDQFDLHQTVNSQDVENAVWHLLCAVRTPKGSIAKARKKFIPIERDGRIPMAEVHDMFGGSLSPADVLDRAKQAGTEQAQFYADLYVGLYYEATGDSEKSARHIAAAADNSSAKNHFMGDVARVHRLIRNREAAAEKSGSS